MHIIQEWIANLSVPVLLIVGIMTVAGFYLGRTVTFIKLPSIIGFMIAGVVLGPSLLGILDAQMQNKLAFITEMALSFVAVSIGLELSFAGLKKQGPAIIVIILTESFLAFGLVSVGIYFLTGNLPLALLFGAIAPASAPAGTVAIIQEYRARGPLTNALYSVLGFDDGLGIIIFGFAAAIAGSMVGGGAGGSAGTEEGRFLALIAPPLKEIGLSFAVGAAAGYVFCLLARNFANNRDIFVLLFAFVCITTGLSNRLHLSHILTNMVLGSIVVNSRNTTFIGKLRRELQEFMPLLFVLFFVLAGANLHISALPSLGFIGLVYIASRSAGLMGGATLGAIVGRAEPTLRKYLGLGILSQAGVAIGLALTVKQEFSALGDAGAYLGATVITTVTATSIVFELIGPITAKIGLKKAGEINQAQQQE